ncbi:hypothetical protein BaRGS_00008051 [Batillaria attramentaria]|uniref:BTB domain-containing protein n=1 Tax=Batillaria attramentaria TaxID=370345 RepID=A0ABD0LMJ9_9CAEN
MAGSCEKTYFKKLVSEMHTLWKQEQLCDVQLQVQNTVIPAHRIVLAAMSPYFRAMFCSHLHESQQSEVKIQGLSSNVVYMITEYAYTSCINLTEENVQTVLHAASIMQISSLEDVCTHFLSDHLHPSNCLGIRDFAQSLGCYSLYNVADIYCQDNFCEVSQNEEFLQLSSGHVLDLVARDALKVRQEEDVYMAVMRWLEYDPEGRAEDMVKIMEKVRLPLVQWEFLMGKVSKHKLFTHNGQCHQYLQQARAFQASSYHPDLNNFAFNEAVMLAQPRIGFGATEYLYAVGGETSNREILSSVEGYNPVTNKTRKLSPLPTPRRSLGVVILEKMIYAVGGSDGSSPVYDIEKDSWKTLASMCEPRTSVSAVAMDSQIFAVGGHDGQQALSTVEVYDVENNSWAHTTWMHTARSMAAAVSLGNQLFVLGGYDGSMDLNSVEKYSLVSLQWTQVASMNEPRSMLDATVLMEKIFVIGGSNGAQCLSSVEVYDPSANQWTILQSLTTPRRGVGVAVIGGAIYAAGGHDGNGYLNSVERYNKYSQGWTVVGYLEDFRGRFGFA